MKELVWGRKLAEEWESHHHKWESRLEETKELVWAPLLVCTICYQWARKTAVLSVDTRAGALVVL
jgi:hypothetical protein